MSKDYFDGAPTVGSNDHIATIEELKAEIQQLKTQLRETQEQLATLKTKEKPQKSKWGKRIGKFFNKYLKPVVDTFSRFLSSIASIKRAFA